MPPLPEGTYVSVLDHINTRLSDLEKAREVALHNLEKRLDGMNEFRDTLKDQAARFITRDELESKLKPLDDKVGIVKEFKDRLEGKASQSTAILSAVLGIIGILIGIYNIFK